MKSPLRLSYILCAIAVLALSWLGFAALADVLSKKRVVILQIVEHPALNATRQGIIDALNKRNLEVRFQIAQGNSALAAQIAQQYVGSKPDILVGIGTSAAQALISANQHQKIPVIFSSVTDPIGGKLVDDLQRPTGFVTGVSNYMDPAIQFNLFKEILPNLSKLGVIYNPGEPNSVALIKKMQTSAEVLGITLMLAPANTSVEVPQAAKSLLNQVDAFFINNDNTALSAFDAIVRISTGHSIPVFSSDVDTIDRGALVAIGPNQYEVGQKTGALILKILDGESINHLGVLFEDHPEIKLNFKQAAQLKISFKDNLIQQFSSESATSKGAVKPHE